MMDNDVVILAEVEGIDSAIVSETDAAQHSSDDEGGMSWLSSSHQHDNHTSTLFTESATEDHDNDDEIDSVEENEVKESAGPGPDFYCSNMDDEDEAYVYKHLRSGTEEIVHVRCHHQPQRQEQQQRGNSNLLEASTDNSSGQSASNNFDSVSKVVTNGEKTISFKEEQQLSSPPSRLSTQANNQQQQQHQHLHQVRLLKPRSSDAILSCPRCFNVVCMDCQQHERYSNQYRAMFVMNIGVDWTKKMIYDDSIGGLKAYSCNNSSSSSDVGGIMDEEGEEDDAPMPDRIPHDNDIVQNSTDTYNTHEEKKEIYFSVFCSYCRLELAALDMNDEIYYFFGCIASS